MPVFKRRIDCVSIDVLRILKRIMIPVFSNTAALEDVILGLSQDPSLEGSQVFLGKTANYTFSLLEKSN